jgi:putative transposase
MPWKKMLALVTGQIEDSLQRKMAYVLEENRVYRALLDRHSPRWCLADTERLAQVLNQYIDHFQTERNHQGLDNRIPFPDERLRSPNGRIVIFERLGGLLNFYHRKAA